MKYINSKVKLKLDVPDEFLDELYQEGMKHYPKEFGGILVGRYSDDLQTCIVEKTILPKVYKSLKVVFERGIKGLKAQLLKYFNQDPKLIYLGEWHTHPDGFPVASQTDKKAMSEIENHQDVRIQFPILLILGINEDFYSVGAYIQHNKQLLNYEKE